MVTDPPYNLGDSPPLSRGAPLITRRHTKGERLTPALAGSTSRPSRPAVTSGTHPRSRGEHISSRDRVASSSDSPPLSRGAHRDVVQAGRDAGLTPALAGSTSADCSRSPGPRTHPRSRGEHTHPAARTMRSMDSPPLSRGAHLRRAGDRPGAGLTPALAGSTMISAGVESPSTTHPRSRGEHDSPGSPPPPPMDSPPLSRGARDGDLLPDVRAGLTPALAGSTSGRLPRRTSTGTHPRSRGEHGQLTASCYCKEDSPPLSRGAQTASMCCGRCRRLTPALAGSTPASIWSCIHFRTHPRSRGEHDVPSVGNTGGSDSPPLSRGAPRPGAGVGDLRGLTPALAGSTRCSPSGLGWNWTHPRSRGEHDDMLAVGDRVLDSPPLSRGARTGPSPRRPLSGLTPALAGSTRLNRLANPSLRTHPRSRGEHGVMRVGVAVLGDSPPLSRGARAARHLRDAADGLTPALAGSTRVGSRKSG